MRRRDPAQAEAAAEWRRRQDAAPWLRDEAPQVESMRLSFDEELEDRAPSGRGYARPVVVASSRAHFEVRCLEPRCDGTHDLTREIMRAIRERRVSDSIRSACEGVCNNVQCQRTLICSFQISYRD